MSDRTFTLMDSLRPQDPKPTESGGVIRLDQSGIARTANPDVAQEVKERYPHMRVVEHEIQTNGKATRSVVWTVPELPWKKNVPNGDKQAQIEARHKP